VSDTNKVAQEKRRFLRSELQVPVVAQKSGRLLWGVSEDIGKGGLFLRSHHPPDLGEELVIRLQDPGKSEPLVLRGRVVHRRDAAKGLIVDKQNRPGGVGIAFEKISPFELDRLGSFISQAGVPPQKDPPLPNLARLEEESGIAKVPHLMEDPAQIRHVLERVAREIRPVRMRRLGGQFVYPVYFRNVRGTFDSLQVEVEAVPLKDFDSAFAEKVPFVFHFQLEDHSHVFSVAERPQAMGRTWSFRVPARVRRSPERRSPRYSHSLEHPLTVEFPDPSDGTIRRVKHVLDVSFGGLAFKNHPGDEFYAPGQSVCHMKICDFDHVCRMTDGVVKHTAFLCMPDGDVFQKVGIEFVTEATSASVEVPAVKEGELEQIDSPSSIVQHLKKVASSRVKILTGLDNSILFSDGQLRAEKKNGGIELSVTSRLLSQDAQSGLIEARLSYHYIHHGTYHFFSARTRKKNGWLCLELPAVIHRARRRRVVRVRPGGMVRTRIRFFHPILGRLITFPVRDLSSRGLSFESDYLRYLLWRGMRLRSCEIMMDDECLPLGSVEVRTLVQSATTDGEWEKHCGVEFLELPAATEKRISAYVFQTLNPEIQAPTAERIDGLWQLFEQSGFIYPNKMSYIRKIRPEIDETWRKLLSDNVPFYKQIVFREGEEELGTASAVQVYEHTWLFQHLAATTHPVRLISKDVMLGLAHFLMENRHTKYLMTYFRKENSFPRKLYSGFLDRYPSEEHFCFSEHSFLSLDLEGPPEDRGHRLASTVRLDDRINVGPATNKDKEVIENYFQKHLHPLLFRSRSLSGHGLHLPETSAIFRSKGLMRERSCLVAKEGNRLVAFALLENSSPGINLSGLLNTFSIYTIDPAGEGAHTARHHLLHAVLDCYRSWGARVAICLTDERDSAVYFDAGFRKEKEYVCLSWSRRMIKSYYHYVQERFGRFEDRKQRTSKQVRHPTDSN
jgi:hypothetical protein